MSNDEAIFFFKGDKGVNRAGYLIKLFVGKFRNLLLNFSHLIVSLVHNVLASSPQKLNEFSIAEGEYYISNLYFLNLDVFIVRIFLHFMKFFIENSFKFYFHV